MPPSRDSYFIEAVYGYGYPAGGDTVSIDKPGTAQTGDLLIAEFVVTEDFVGANAAPVSANATWTVLHTAVLSKTGEPDSWWYVASRVVDGTEPATFTWTCGDGGPTILGYGGGISCYRGLTYSESAFTDHLASDTMTDQLAAPTTTHVTTAIDFYTSTVVSPPVWSTATGIGVLELAAGVGGLILAVFLIGSAWAQGSMGTKAPLIGRLIQGQPQDPHILVGIWDQMTLLLAGGGITEQNYCGVKVGEVFEDVTGGRGYLGSFAFGVDNFGDPLGWTHCLGTCQNQLFFKDLFGQFDPNNEPCRCDAVVNTPRINVGFDKGCESIIPGWDVSGPTGLEAAQAMFVGLDGTLNNNVGFAGSQAYDDGGGTFVQGLLNGDTGWHKDPTVPYWVFECWARISDDGGAWEGATGDPAGGQFTDGATLSFHMAAEGHSDAAVSGSLGTTNSLALTTDWQFFQVIFSGSSGQFGIAAAWYWPVVHVSTMHKYVIDYVINWFGSRIHRSGYAARGEVAIKCPHLYPYNQSEGPIWFNDFHGHDR